MLHIETTSPNRCFRPAFNAGFSESERTTTPHCGGLTDWEGFDYTPDHFADTEPEQTETLSETRVRDFKTSSQENDQGHDDLSTEKPLRKTDIYAETSGRGTRFGARWYAPEIGRWVSGDLLFVHRGKLNTARVMESSLYVYITNDPINSIDPTGKWELKVTIAGGAGIQIRVGYKGGSVSVGVSAVAGVSAAPTPVGVLPVQVSFDPKAGAKRDEASSISTGFSGEVSAELGPGEASLEGSINAKIDTKGDVEVKAKAKGKIAPNPAVPLAATAEVSASRNYNVSDPAGFKDKVLGPKTNPAEAQESFGYGGYAGGIKLKLKLLKLEGAIK